MAVAKTSLLVLTNNILQKLGEAKVTDVSAVSTGVAFNVLNMIHDTVYQIYNRGNWTFLQTQFTHDGTYTLTFTGSPATRKLTLPDEINENFIQAVLLVTGVTGSEDDADTAATLSYTDPLQFFKDHPYDDAATVGTPTEYTMYGRIIFVNPRPTDATYSLKLFAARKYAEATWANTNTFSIPTEFEYLIESGAMWQYLARDNAQAAQLWKAKFDEGMAVLAQQYGIPGSYDNQLK